MYNTVNITGTNVWTNDSGEAVTVTLTPLAFYFDMASNVKINPLPVTTASDVNGNWTLGDVPDPTPNGSGIPWKLVVQDKNSGTTLFSRDVQPAFSQGTSQQWLSLPVPPPNAGVTTYMGPQGPQGPQGPAGPPSPAGAAGHAGLTWMGPWTNTTAYTPSDVVQYQGSTYVATADVTSTSPGSPASPNAPWHLLAHLGAADVPGTANLPGAADSAGGAHAAFAAHAADATGATGASVVSVKDAPFNAAGDGVTDDTRAIQAAINYATTNNAVTHFPSSGPADYRVSQLVIPSGAILEGVSSGTYPGNKSIAGVSALTRLGGTNRDLLLLPDGNNYCHIRDIQIDGNKKNNTTGDGIHISDGTAGQEGQIVIERCYVHDNPGHNIYLGHLRRANKVLNSVCNYAVKDGICVAGSDNTVTQNICGTNGRAGINLGTSHALHWAADASQSPAAVTHVISNDIYGNQVGINVSSGSWGNVISSNGIDRNSDEGVAVYDGYTPATIHANVLHSNSGAADDACPHIGLGVNVDAVEIAANIFGPCDAGITNLPSYGVHAASTSTHVNGDLGIIYPKSTNHGLT
jgi:Pectate lyase superfamily protein